MQAYKNNSGQSGVLAYQNGTDYIIVQFAKGRDTFYKYTHSSAGATVIDHMKQLAELGNGLNTYISSKSTSPNYAAKAPSLAGVM